MKRLGVIFFFVFAGLSVRAQAEDRPPLLLVQAIPLNDVEGRIDHLAIDLKSQRLFVAALSNNTVEVIDLKAGKKIRSLTGFHEPQGIVFLPELNRLIVTNGGDGSCRILDADSFAVIKDVRLSDDADNIRYDEATKNLYVGHGDGNIGIIEAMTGNLLGNIRLASHPESFQIEKRGKRMFINVPGANQIAIVDREKRAVTTKWSLKGIWSNYPMALDETHHRLFVGFRKPPNLAVFDTESGQRIASLRSVGDADDIFYDEARGQIYMSCGKGFLEVFKAINPEHYQEITKIPTASGARTAFFAPELNRLYLAVPHRLNQKAEILIYEAR